MIHQSSPRISYQRSAKDKTYAEKVDRDINTNTQSSSTRRRIIKASCPAPPVATSPVVSTIEQQPTSTPALKRTRAKKRTANNIETTIPPPSSTTTTNTTNSEVCTTPTPQLLAATPTTTSTIENTPHSNHTANDEDASPRPSKRRCTTLSTFMNGLYMCRDMISTIIGLLKSFANNTPAAAPVGGETNTDYGAGGVDSGWDVDDEEEIHDPSSESDNKKPQKKRYDQAKEDGDIDHGFVFRRELVSIKHGRTLEQLHGMALGECEDVWLENREAQNFQDPNNTLCFTNAKEVAKNCKYKDWGNLLKCVEHYQSPEEEANWSASSGVKMLPYEVINAQSNPYRDDMVFKFQCKYFYTGGLQEIAKLEQNCERRKKIPYKKDRGAEWDALGWNPTQGRKKGDMKTQNGRQFRWNGKQYRKLCIVPECKCQAKERCKNHTQCNR